MADNWLKQRRTELHLSQDELATALQLRGIEATRATVSHWEVGRHNPPLDQPEFTNALAQVLNMSVTEVLTSAGYRFNLDALSDLERGVIEAWRRGDKVQAIRTIVNE